MSLTYEVNAKLNCLFTKKNIKILLKKTLEQDFIHTYESFGQKNLQGINNNVYIKAILDSITDTTECFILGTRFKDEEFTTSFCRTEENTIEFGLGNFKRKKDFEIPQSYYGAEYQFYLELLLDICDNFCITQLNANVED